jgi:hypothetical protein
MKTSGTGGIAPPSLTSVLDGGEWLASRPDRFTRAERAPGTLSRSGRYEEEKSLASAWNRTLDTQPIARRIILCTISYFMVPVLQ